MIDQLQRRAPTDQTVRVFPYHYFSPYHLAEESPVAHFPKAARLGSYTAHLPDSDDLVAQR